MLRDGGNHGGGYGAEVMMMQGGLWLEEGWRVLGVHIVAGVGHGARSEGS